MRKNTAFTQLQTAAGREIQSGSSSYLFFGGTAYLGLQQHPGLMELYIQGMQRYGINNGTSRNNNVQLAIYSEAEEAAAKRFGATAALITSSGYLAAQMTVKHFAGKGEVFYAPACHPALWIDKAPLVSKTFSEWAATTVEQINRSGKQDFVVISNTLNNLVPEKYELTVFEKIDRQKRIHFILDDSHGIGIMPQPDDIRKLVPPHPGFTVTVVASLAKGLSADAGLVLSDTATIAELKQHPIFIGASPPAPAAMYAFLHAEQIVKERKEILQQHMQFFEQQLAVPCQYIPGFPVYYFPEAGLYERLLKKGIIISGFPYPLPTDPFLNRAVLSSLHTQKDIEQLLAAIHLHV